MKLGILLDRFDGTAGGAEAHTAALMMRALEQGDGVALACLSGRGPEGVETISIAARGRRPARDRAFAEAGAAALRGAGCDVVFAIRHALSCDVYLPHGGLVDDALAAKDEAAGGPGALARLGRAWGGKHAFFQEAEAALLERPEGPLVVAVSRLVADRVRARYPAAARRTRVVVNGVDSAHFDPVPAADAGVALRAELVGPGALVGLLVAHHPLLKGVEAAIGALAQPEVQGGERPFHLLVVGGALPARARRLAKDLGVSERVHTRPAGDDMRPHYAAADILVHPTYHDPCSLVCLEALSMGLPVITTPRNGIAEVMGQHGGIVVERPGDPEALAVAIRVLSEDAMRAATSRDARDLALAHPLVERLDAVLDICRLAAAQGG